MEDPRCDFFALSPRARRIIIIELNLAEKYRLMTVSNRFQQAVKSVDLVYDLALIDLKQDVYKFHVQNGPNLEIRVVVPETYSPTQRRRQRRRESMTSLIYVDFQDDPHSVQSRKDKFSSVLRIMADAFKFTKTKLKITPKPDFIDLIERVSRDFSSSFDLVDLTDSTENPLLRPQLKCAVTTLSGVELITENVEDNVQHDDLLVKFEVIRLGRTNWLNIETIMLLENNPDDNLREVHLKQAPDTGLEMSLENITIFTRGWYGCFFQKLEHFSCYNYTDKPMKCVMRVLRDHLAKLQTEPPNLAIEEYHRIARDHEEARFIQGLTKKWAVVYVNDEGFRKEIVFKTFDVFEIDIMN